MYKAAAMSEVREPRRGLSEENGDGGVVWITTCFVELKMVCCALEWAISLEDTNVSLGESQTHTAERWYKSSGRTTVTTPPSNTSDIHPPIKRSR